MHPESYRAQKKKAVGEGGYSSYNMQINVADIANDLQLRNNYTKEQLENRDLEGWSDTLMDILEETYGLESAIYKYLVQYAKE